MTLFNEVSEAYGGKVYRGSISDLEKFLTEKEFDTDGMRSFLRTCKIPPHFFKRHPEKLQQDMLTSMKSELKADELYFIEHDNKIVFAAPAKGMDPINPKDKFLCLNNDNWKLQRRDFYSGMERYVYLPQDLVVNEYITTIYLDIPILYTGSINFDIGMYKVLCSNGLLDSISSSSFKLKPDSFLNNIFEAILEGIINSLSNCNQSFSSYLNFLKTLILSGLEAKELIATLLKEKVIVRKVALQSVKCLDLLEQGNIVDEKLPSTCANYYDLLDIVTFYAQKLPTIGMQKKTEANIFKYFYTRYNLATGNKLQGLNVKEFVPQQPVIESEDITITPRKSNKKNKTTTNFEIPNIDKLTDT